MTSRSIPFPFRSQNSFSLTKLEWNRNLFAVSHSIRYADIELCSSARNIGMKQKCCQPIAHTYIYIFKATFNFQYSPRLGTISVLISHCYYISGRHNDKKSLCWRRRRGRSCSRCRGRLASVRNYATMWPTNSYNQPKLNSKCKHKIKCESNE